MSIYPDVPDVAGVPQLLRNPFSPIPLPSLLTADEFGTSVNAGAQQWGLFDDSGNPVIVADSVIAFDFRQNYTLADYPIEEGSFETYDKVQRPYDIRLTFAQGGSEQDRVEFLNSVIAIVGDTNLYTAVMPERDFLNVNVEHYDFKREAHNGLGLLTVNLYLTQVRADVQQQYSAASDNSGAITSPANPSNTKDPGSNAFVDNGVLQPFNVQTLQPPVSAASPGATGIAGDPAATTAPTQLSPNVATTTKLPLMTPANQAEGFHYGTAPSLIDGLPATPTQAATQSTYTLDQFSGGTKIYNPIAGTSSVVPAGKAPQSLGVQ